MAYVTRYAPSPTWHQHIGGIRTALYCQLLAQQTNWKFLLRFEDTDQARSTKLYEESMMDSFKWCGLSRDAWPDNPDENGPYYQMKRLEIYNTYVQQLLDQWDAYYAWETSEELEAMRIAAYANKKAFNYRRIEYTQAQLEQYKNEWRTPVIRLSLPMKEVTFVDQVKWETTFDLRQFGDFVIVKSDGIPTYYLANVVDDHLQKITHVIRGEEHLSNTPKQIALYEALGWEMPSFAHLPLMLNTSGKKMSKRDTDIGLILVPQFQDEWFLPEAIINFIALLGWNPWTEQEIFTYDQLLESFSMERVQSSNAVYDFKRALWFNSEWIKNMSDEDFVSRLKWYLYLYGNEEWKEIIESTQEDYWLTFAAYIKVRLQTFGQFRDHAQYFFLRPTVDSQLVNREKMKVTDELVRWYLPKLITLLEHLDDSQWTEETIKEELIAFTKWLGLKNGQTLWPVRAILTGAQASPGAFEMLTVLGKEESIVRLKAYM